MMFMDLKSYPQLAHSTLRKYSLIHLEINELNIHGTKLQTMYMSHTIN
jgi:hypothetical protein